MATLEIEPSLIKALNKTFETAVSKKMNSVPIDLSEDNVFKCDKCAAENKVQIDISTILPTNIIYDK